MKTKSYNVYSFAELSPKAQAKAIEEHTQFLGEQFDSSPTIDDAKTAFAFAGIAIDRVYFSGFWSQGDGACFEGSFDARNVNANGLKEYAPQDAELHRIAQGMAEIAARFPFASFAVKHRGHYRHDGCTSFDINLGDESADESSEDAAQAEESLIRLARDAMRWIYRQLKKEYEYQTGEEQVRESILANEYEFTAEGEID